MVGYAKLEISLGSDYWWHALYRMLAVFNLVELSDQLKTEVKSIGLHVQYNSQVVEVQDNQVVTQDGKVYPFDYLVFASGM